jgi:hypothetical protein
MVTRNGPMADHVDQSALGTNQSHATHISYVSLTPWRKEYTLEPGHSLA